MRCFMTESIVLYSMDVRQIWNKNPGETIVCSRYEYDEDNDTHLFWLGDELQGKLQGGEYALSMNEFLLTEMRDHPEEGPGICQ